MSDNAIEAIVYGLVALGFMTLLLLVANGWPSFGVSNKTLKRIEQRLDEIKAGIDKWEKE